MQNDGDAVRESAVLAQAAIVRALTEELEHCDPLSPASGGLRAQIADETGRLEYRLAQMAACADHPEKITSPSDAPDPGKPRVLIVEDDPGTRTALAHWLSENYEVDTACDGAEGLEHASAFPPDVIVADVWMPRLDGISMVSLMKRVGSLRPVPVVFLTGQTSLESVEAGIAAGAVAYVEKPIDLDVFEHKLRAVLEGSGTEAFDRAEKSSKPR